MAVDEAAELLIALAVVVAVIADDVARRIDAVHGYVLVTLSGDIDLCEAEGRHRRPFAMERNQTFIGLTDQAARQKSVRRGPFTQR